MIEIPIPQERVHVYNNRQEWLDARTDSEHAIGGSAVARILGISPHGGPWSVWSEWHGERRRTNDDIEKTLRRGRALENVALSLGAEDFGLHLELPRNIYAGGNPEAEIVINGDEPWMRVTPDAFGVCLASNMVIGAEAKTSGIPEDWGESCEIVQWGEGAENLLPPHYAVQVYWYLEATKLPAWDLCALILNRGMTIKRFRLWADHDVQKRLVDRVGEWRQRHLIEGHEPDPTGERECISWLAKKHGPSVLEYREPTNGELAMAREWREISERQKADEDRLKQLRAELLTRIGPLAGLDLGMGQAINRIYRAGYKVAPTPYTVEPTAYVQLGRLKTKMPKRR